MISVFPRFRISAFLFGGLATWFSRGLTILLGLVLMPVLFRHLSREELGAWLLLGQSWVALGIFDFGFGMILTRRLALCLGKNPGGANRPLDDAIKGEVSDLVATGRWIFRGLALFAFCFSFASGFFYLRSLELGGLPISTVWAAWGVLCVSQALGIWATGWTCLLQALGFVGWDTILASLISSSTLLLQIVLVLFGGGLISLAVAAASGALAQRSLIIWFARRHRPEVFLQPGHWRPQILRDMLSPALRAWLTSLGYLLIANTDQFFIASQKGAGSIPAYRAAYLLVINLHFLAGVFCGPSQVFVSYLWQSGQLQRIQAILRRNARIGLLSMSCGGAAILALGPSLFELWLGPGNFVGSAVLGIFLASFILEHHANVFSSSARATDDEAYAVSSLAGGILKLGLAFVLSSRLGLTGLALSTLVAQGLTNDWFMVYRSMRRLQISFSDHVKEVLLPCLLLFLATLGLAFLIGHCLRGQPVQIRVALVSALAGGLLGASLWRLALNTSQRTRILRWGKFA